MFITVRSLWALPFLLVIAPSLSSGQHRNPPPADPPSPARNEEVLLDVLVRQRDTGRVITGFGKDDFAIFENGRRQQVAQFSPDDMPLSIVLLLDLSASMDMVFKRLRESSRASWQRLQPQDEVAVMAFAKEVKLLQGFMSDKQLIAGLVEKTYAEVRDIGKLHTSLDEAVYQAATYLRTTAKSDRRQMLVVISDDLAYQEGGHSHKDALKELLTSAVIVHGLVVFDPAATHYLSDGGINDYAEQTGGISFSIAKAGLAYLNKLEISDRLTALLESLHGRYRLTYVPADPKPDGKFRRIKVACSAPGAKRMGRLDVLTRSGYYPPAGKP
jgi:VWFA-related protein